MPRRRVKTHKSTRGTGRGKKAEFALGQTDVAIGARRAAPQPAGLVNGVAVAVVTDNRDPNGRGRVKVRFPWYEKPSESYWARIAVPAAGKQQGAYFVPAIGEEVLVAFERGDLRFPVVIGALWSGKDPPPTSKRPG
jgi:uncharacterized protein involved in type VI secretion and phage assembly